MRSRIDVLTAHGGTTIANDIPHKGLVWTRTVDNDDELSFRLPYHLAWLADLELRHVLRVTDTFSRVTQWSVKSIDETFAAGSDGFVTITGESFLVVLNDMVTITHAGRPAYQLAGVEATAAHFIDSYILPPLHNSGLTWVQRGTIDNATRLVSLSWSAWSCRQLLEALRGQLRAELNFKLNGSNYEIELLDARNSALTAVLVQLDRNIPGLQRTRRVDELRTVLVFQGLQPDGDNQASTIGYFVGEISAIDGGTARITVTDPVTGEPLIWFDDEFGGSGHALCPNRYLLKPDATLVQITDTLEATQQLQLSSVAGLAVGDRFEIRANSSGDLLTEICNPAAVSRWGRVVGPVEDSDLRGERNHVPNPFMETWTLTDGDVIRAEVNGAHTATRTLVLKNCSSNVTIDANDMVFRMVNGTRFVVGTGGTIVAGAVTLQLDPAGPTITAADNDVIHIHRLHALPTGWQRSSTSMLYGRVDPSDDTALSGLANGTQTGVFHLVLDGLGVGSINYGDILNWAGSTYAVAMGKVTVDGSGNAIVPVNRSVSITDNAAITITKPTLENAGGNVVWLPCDSGGYYWRTPSYKLRLNSNSAPVQCAVALDLMPGDTTTTYTGSAKCKVEVYNETTGAVIATITDADRTLVRGTMVNIDLRDDVSLTVDTTLHLRVYPPAVSLSNGLYIYVKSAMIAIATDPNVPAVDGSHANKGLLLLHETLEEASQEPLFVQATYADLSRLNEKLAAEKIAEGQNVRLRLIGSLAGQQDEDRTARIVSLRWDDEVPENNELTIATIEPRLTRAVTRQAGQKLFVPLAVLSDGSVVVGSGAAAAGASVGAVIGSVTTTPQRPPEHEGGLVIKPLPGDPPDGPLPIRTFSKRQD